MYQKTAYIKNQKICYQVKESQKAKHLRLTVYPGGNLVITKPKNITQDFVEKVIHNKTDWILKKINQYQQLPAYFFDYNNETYQQYKNQALNFVLDKLNYYNQFYKFKFNRIRIKNQKTRWGSCSKKGNLNFNYKIIFLPDDLANYLIVHELCHLKELNHSANFWALVNQTIPEYQQKRKAINSSNLS